MRHYIEARRHVELEDCRGCGSDAMQVITRRPVGNPDDEDEVQEVLSDIRDEKSHIVDHNGGRIDLVMVSVDMLDRITNEQATD
jgi:hypothetical protein